MMNYTRAQRRALAKQLGLKKQTESHDQWINRIKRSSEAGKQIHAQNLAEQEQRIREKEAESNFITLDIENLAESKVSDGDIITTGKIVNFEKLQDTDERNNQDLSDFGIITE